MRKVIAGLFVSLDGVAGAPHEWHLTYFSDEMGASIDREVQASDALLLGRVTFEEFAGYWPSAPRDENPLAAFMNDSPKYVVSDTLESADAWANSSLIRGADLAAEVKRLKGLPGKNLNVIGSMTLVRSLLEHGLLDELHLLVHPVVVGSGKRLFPEGALTTHKLELLRAAETLPNGVVSLAFRPAPAQ
jgi:dihydrofolate reductase